ncbi:hypothetical protein CRYUN_Cryun07bG0108100 [Craigia yunnanensis]
MPRNLRYMRLKVWINPHAPLIAGCMLRMDDRVMHWVDFHYERVYKVCRRCGIIGHSSPYYPHLNPDIERMIGEQMEIINRRFNVNTRYDLQHVLFTNKIKTFHNRGTRRTTGIESVRRYQMNQTGPIENAELPKTWLIPDRVDEEENTYIMMEDTENNPETQSQPTPLITMLSEEAQAEWKNQQNQL